MGSSPASPHSKEGPGQSHLASHENGKVVARYLNIPSCSRFQNSSRNSVLSSKIEDKPTSHPKYRPKCNPEDTIKDQR